MLVKRAHRKETAHVHAQANGRGRFTTNTVGHRARKRAHKGIHDRHRQKQQAGDIGAKAVGILKVERQHKLGGTDTHEHDKHASQVNRESRARKAATRRLCQRHRAFASLRLDMRQRVESHDKRDDANGKVDEEDALPGKTCHEYAAEHGAAHHAKSHKGRQNAHGTTALTRRKRLGDDAHIVGHRGGTANALHDTRQDKHLERSRKPAKQRATRKDDHTKLEHIHLAAHIAQAAKRQHGDARREQIRRAHELNAVETHTQLLLHHRKRHRHDARIQTRHKGHDEHGEQNRPFILTVGVALQGNVFAAQLLGSFLHIYPFYRATQKRDPNHLQTVTIGVPPTESEL